jgi:hypothetical protein
VISEVTKLVSNSIECNDDNSYMGLVGIKYTQYVFSAPEAIMLNVGRTNERKRSGLMVGW